MRYFYLIKYNVNNKRVFFRAVQYPSIQEMKLRENVYPVKIIDYHEILTDDITVHNICKYLLKLGFDTEQANKAAQGILECYDTKKGQTWL